jgi:hypothetical protein
MTAWVVISVLVGGVGVLIRWALQWVVVIWSLKDGEDRHQHAIDVLKVLRKDRPPAIERLRALTRNVPRSGDGPRDTESDDQV